MLGLNRFSSLHKQGTTPLPGTRGSEPGSLFISDNKAPLKQVKCKTLLH